jgi:small redox-active disulfide protein 2
VSIKIFRNFAKYKTNLKIMIMEIKVLGTGCPKCRQLEQVVNEAISNMEIKPNVVKEEDITRIMSYGVMRTPALVINEKVVLSGRVPTVKEVKELIEKNK